MINGEGLVLSRPNKSKSLNRILILITNLLVCILKLFKRSRKVQKSAIFSAKMLHPSHHARISINSMNENVKSFTDDIQLSQSGRHSRTKFVTTIMRINRHVMKLLISICIVSVIL